MDTRRVFRDVRWASMGGTGRIHAPGRRIVPISAAEFWPVQAGPADVFFICMAAYLQRAALDRFGMSRRRAICKLSVAGIGKDLFRSSALCSASAGRQV